MAFVRECSGDQLSDEDWLGQARAELLRSLDELPSADRLARALNVSRRTLYRRLAEYGTSYGALCDDVRKSLAEDHLAHTGVPLIELAQILGYNDASNFSKAFKRWTGKSPGAWRASLEGS